MAEYASTIRMNEAGAVMHDRHARDRELDGLASLDYHARLAEFIKGSTRHAVRNDTTVVDFRPLYAVTIHHLQRQLAEQIRDVEAEGVSEEGLARMRSLLEEYTVALRNFEFIHGNRFCTQFVKDIAASRIDDGVGSRLQHALIADLDLKLRGQRNSIYSDADLLGSFDCSLLQHTPTLGRTRASHVEALEQHARAKQQLKETWRRFAFAIVGATAVVVPSMIIAYDQAPVRTLVVVAVSIFVFSCTVAVFSVASPENLLAATAAYSAVLMVFMGNYQ